jgi:hypothetical protein
VVKIKIPTQAKTGSFDKLRASFEWGTQLLSCARRSFALCFLRLLEFPLARVSRTKVRVLLFEKFCFLCENAIFENGFICIDHPGYSRKFDLTE